MCYLKKEAQLISGLIQFKAGRIQVALENWKIIQ